MKIINITLNKMFVYKVFLIMFLIASCKKAVIYRHKNKISSVVLDKIARGEEISDNEIIENLNEQDGEGKSLLILAVEKENKKLVARLINLNTDINIEDEDGNTALMIAEERNSIEIISLLNNASSSTTALSLSSVSSVALPSGSEELLVEGLPPYYTPTLSTPMIDAISSYDLDLIKELLRDNEEVLQERNLDGDTPLIVAIKSEKEGSVSLILDHPKVVQIVDAVNIKGESALHCAIEVESIDLCISILEKGADINISDYDTPLIVAVRNSDLEILKLLLDRGADPNRANSKGETALMIAVSMCDSSALNMLLNVEIDLLIENEEGENVFFYALRNLKRVSLTILRALVDAFVKRSIEIEEEAKERLINYLMDLKILMSLEREDPVKHREISECIEKLGINALELARKRRVVEEIREKARVEKRNIVILAMEELKDEEFRLDTLRWLIPSLDSEEINRLESRSSALIYAIEGGELEVVKLLLSNTNIDINIAGRGRKTALIIAVEMENIEIIRELLKKDSDIEIRDKRSKTALDYVLEKGNIGIFELFCEIEYLKDNINIKNGVERWKEEREDALLEVSKEGYVNVLKILLDLGVDVNIVKEGKNTALMYAVGRGHEKLVKVLLDSGANIDAKSDDYMLLMPILSPPKGCENLNSNDTDIAPNRGGTALMIAAGNGHDEIVRMLISCGANVEDRSTLGTTPLMAAAYNSHNQVVRTLLAYRVNIEANINGVTALMIAAQNGHNEVVETLLAHNANLEVITSSGETALMTAARNGHNEVVKILLAHGANIDDIDSNGGTALMCAVVFRHNEVIETLLAHDVNIDACDKKKGTALMLAAFFGYNEIVKMLLAHGANIKMVDADGCTVFITAAYKGCNEVVKTLLAHGANIEAKDNSGWTALMYAAQDGHEEVVKTLISHGANINSTNYSGFTALIIALLHGRTNIVRLLRS